MPSALNFQLKFVQYALAHFTNNLPDGLLFSMDTFDSASVKQIWTPVYLTESIRDNITLLIQQNISTITPKFDANANAQLVNALKNSRLVGL